MSKDAAARQYFSPLAPDAARTAMSANGPWRLRVVLSPWKMNDVWET